MTQFALLKLMILLIKFLQLLVWRVTHKWTDTVLYIYWCHYTIPQALLCCDLLDPWRWSLVPYSSLPLTSQYWTKHSVIIHRYKLPTPRAMITSDFSSSLHPLRQHVWLWWETYFHVYCFTIKDSSVRRDQSIMKVIDVFQLIM